MAQNHYCGFGPFTTGGPIHVNSNINPAPTSKLHRKNI